MGCESTICIVGTPHRNIVMDNNANASNAESWRMSSPGKWNIRTKNVIHSIIIIHGLIITTELFQVPSQTQEDRWRRDGTGGSRWMYYNNIVLDIISTKATTVHRKYVFDCQYVQQHVSESILITSSVSDHQYLGHTDTVIVIAIPQPI